MPAATRRRATAPQLDYIVEALRPMAVPIEGLVLDPDNPRIHDQLNMEAITASLRQFGQQLPIVVRREDNVVVAGNGRLKAAQGLGWTHIAVIFSDDRAAVAKAFGIADNRTSELAKWDNTTLARLLDEIQDETPELLEQVGFEAREIESLLTRYLPELTPPPAAPGANGSAPAAPANGSAPAADGGDPIAPPAALANPLASMRYVNMTYDQVDYDCWLSVTEFFKLRYGTTITPDAVLKALTEFRESLQE